MWSCESCEVEIETEHGLCEECKAIMNIELDERQRAGEVIKWERTLKTDLEIDLYLMEVQGHA